MLNPVHYQSHNNELEFLNQVAPVSSIFSWSMSKTFLKKPNSGVVVSVIVFWAVFVAVLGVVHAVKLKISTMINNRLNNLNLRLIFYHF